MCTVFLCFFFLSGCKGCLSTKAFISAARKTALFAKEVYPEGTRPGRKGPFAIENHCRTIVRGGMRCMTALCLAILCAIVPIDPARAESDTAPATQGTEEGRKRSFSTGTDFFDEAGLSGGVYYFQRDRRRLDREKGRYANHLNHATLTGVAEFSSGFIGGVLGADIGIFGTHDIQSTGAPDHEMNFVPWGNPWHPDWSATRTQDGVSVYKAQVKAKAGPLWAQGGYFQPSGPGVLGVNWSILPGTYRGVNAGAEFGGFSLAMAWADAYKAPWYREVNEFYKNDGESRVPWLWSIGAKNAFEGGFSLEAAYGESKNHLWNAHLKAVYAKEQEGSEDGLTAGYHLYLMGDNDNTGASANDNFDGTASQHYLFVRYSADMWEFGLEGLYTRAPFTNEEQRGYFAYRLTDRNGSSKGAYEAWWDARSDWNTHNEKAVFGSVRRSLDDILPVDGFAVKFGAGLGWDGEAYATAGHLKEWAFTLDIDYTHPDGPLKGAFVKLHLTNYTNGTEYPSWAPYKNVFQSERDIKVFAGIPFDI